MRREIDLLGHLVGYQSAKIVERNDVSAIVATNAYHGGIFDSAGGHLHPLNYAIGLAKAAEAAGARIFEETPAVARSEEHTSELQSLMRISYAVFCLKKK